MIRRNNSFLASLGMTIAALACASLASAQTSTTDEIAKYRAALQDGNPAELWEARGEALWKAKRGPKQVTLESCDLGKGLGVVKGAYAELPRYFADADRVMDLETRLVWCMVQLQGYHRSGREEEPVRQRSRQALGSRSADRVRDLASRAASR